MNSRSSFSRAIIGSSSILLSLTRWVVLGVSFCALLPYAAYAACSDFDASGRWEAVQSNGFVVQFKLKQSGTVLHGTASYPVHDDGLFLVGPLDMRKGGRADGAIRGRKVMINVYWDSNNSIGIYKGTVGSDGHINGVTYDKLSPSNVATWFTHGSLKCK
jgi:hypothetical protein